MQPASNEPAPFASAVPQPSADPPLPDFVEIGAHTYCARGSIRFSSFVPGEKIIIGKYCSIARGVHFFVGGNHRMETVSTFAFDNLFLGKPNPSRSYRPTRNTQIGNDVWLGHQAHIAGGVQIGHGAVVGSRAVVFSDVPPYGILTGNPARLIRYRFSRPIVESLLRIAWWDWPDEMVRANIEWFYRPVTEFVNHFEPR